MSDPVTKRATFEPAERLLRPLAHDPDMPRPPATTVGAILVVLRVAAGAFVLTALAEDWQTLVPAAAVAVDWLDAADSNRVALWLVIGVGILVLLTELLFAYLIYRGFNTPRVLVMVFEVLWIGGAFAAWWNSGQAITIDGTLLSLGLDILILLALSSRDAAAYARRNERR